MANQSDDMIRHALDSVDRARRRMMGVVAALFGLTAVSLGFLFNAAANATEPGRERGVLKLIFVATATEMLFVACCTVVVMLHISRVGRSVIRAGHSP